MAPSTTVGTVTPARRRPSVPFPSPRAPGGAAPGPAVPPDSHSGADRAPAPGWLVPGSDTSLARGLSLYFLPGTPTPAPEPWDSAWKHSEKRRDRVLSSERGPGDGKPRLTLVRQARPGRLTQVAWRGAGRASPAGEQRGSFGSELRENSTPRPKGESKASLLKRGYHSREGGVLSEAPGESPSARRPAREYRVRERGRGRDPSVQGIRFTCHCWFLGIAACGLCLSASLRWRDGRTV